LDQLENCPHWRIALVGTWEIMVPSGRGQSRWIWQMMADGTYKFDAEGGRATPAHEGMLTAANGRWTLHALKGLSKDYGSGACSDGALRPAGPTSSGRKHPIKR
jgi:hypothetical protein